MCCKALASLGLGTILGAVFSLTMSPSGHRQLVQLGGTDISVNVFMPPLFVEKESGCYFTRGRKGVFELRLVAMADELNIGKTTVHGAFIWFKSQGIKTITDDSGNTGFNAVYRSHVKFADINGQIQDFNALRNAKQIGPKEFGFSFQVGDRVYVFKTIGTNAQSDCELWEQTLRKTQVDYCPCSVRKKGKSEPTSLGRVQKRIDDYKNESLQAFDKESELKHLKHHTKTITKMELDLY